MELDYSVDLGFVLLMLNDIRFTWNLYRSNAWIQGIIQINMFKVVFV